MIFELFRCRLTLYLRYCRIHLCPHLYPTLILPRGSGTQCVRIWRFIVVIWFGLFSFVCDAFEIGGVGKAGEDAYIEVVIETDQWVFSLTDQQKQQLIHQGLSNLGWAGDRYRSLRNDIVAFALQKAYADAGGITYNPWLYGNDHTILMIGITLTPNIALIKDHEQGHRIINETLLAALPTTTLDGRPLTGPERSQMLKSWVDQGIQAFHRLLPLGANSIEHIRAQADRYRERDRQFIFDKAAQAAQRVLSTPPVNTR